MPWEQACRIVARVARALHAAHAAGIVHRDVKPANIMLLPSGDPKVMDFGIARVPASELTRAGEVFGTPSNMSPEQASGDALDGRSDLFSLGTVLYQLLTGRRAFTGENLPKILAAVVQHAPAPPSASAPVPAALDGVVAMTLAKAPGDRYPTGQAMAEDLEDVAAGRAPRHASGRTADPTIAIRRPPLGAPVAAPAARRGVVVPAALAAAAVVAVLAGWTLATRPAAPPAAIAGAAARRGAVPAPAPDSDSPARMTVDFEHHMRSGSLKVWVDDTLVLDRPLEGRLAEKFGRVRLYKGRVLETLDVAPGRRTVRAEVAWDGKVRTARSAATFRPDAPRTLDIEVLRVLDDLTLEWR
jgi:hypothetical protein